MSYPNRTLIAAVDLGSNPLVYQLLKAWSTPASEQDLPNRTEIDDIEEEPPLSLEEKGKSEENSANGKVKVKVKVEVNVKAEEQDKGNDYSVRSSDLPSESEFEDEETEDVLINLVSSDSYFDSEDESEEEKEAGKKEGSELNSQENESASLYQSRFRSSLSL